MWVVLETWNLVHKYKHIHGFRRYTFYHQGPLSFADVNIFFRKNLHFLAKIVLLLKAIVWQLWWRFLALFPISFRDYASKIWLLNYSELVINRKNDNDVSICQHDIIINFFWCCFVPLVKLSYWSKFMLISSLVMELQQFIKMLQKRWKCYWMLQNAPVTAFTIYELIKENHTSPTPTQICEYLLLLLLLALTL